MRDEETGSWWQQVSGEAILGPLKGRHLNPVVHDEVTFAIWKQEQPAGRVLRPDSQFADKYVPADWEERIGRLPVVTSPDTADAFPARELVVGITASGASKAYSMSRLQRESPVLDSLGGVPLLIVVNDKSVRAFERQVDGAPVEFFAKPSSSPLRLVDSGTGSEWDFTGRSVAGPMAGKQLKKVQALSDFWFDWKIYHPNTTIY
jgi:uncharacterized protein DUF3179